MRKKAARANSLSANPVAVALHKAKPMPADLVDQMRLRELSSIEAVSKGKYDKRDIETLTALEGLCRASAELGMGAEALNICDDAKLVIANLATENFRNQPSHLDPVELVILQILHKLHDEQRNMCTFGEYLKIVDFHDSSTKKKLFSCLAA